MSHIEFTELLGSFEQPEASSSRRFGIESHVADCGKCAAVYQKLAEFFEHAEAVGKERVPQATTAHLLNIFRPAPRNASAVKSTVPFLVFDDWSSVVYERHGGIDTRQLLYRVGEYEVDLRLEFVDDRCIVTGQLLPDRPGARIDVSGANGCSSSVVADTGEFELAPLSQGTYDITISTAEPAIEIKDVPLHQ